MATKSTLFAPTKTYANEANLVKAIDKLVPENFRYTVVYTEEGRCFAIFMGSEAFPVVHRGFSVIGG